LRFLRFLRFFPGGFHTLGPAAFTSADVFAS
jgi:hypothetical protein